MHWNEVESSWMTFKGRVKAQWGKRTDDHLDGIGGKRIALANPIQAICGITSSEPEQRIKGIEAANKNSRQRFLRK